MSDPGTTPHQSTPEPHPRTGYPTTPYGLPPQPPNPYASWLKRVGAYLIDSLLVTVAYFPAFIGVIISASDTSDALATSLTVLGALLSLAVFVWNTCLRGGRTGYSIGKGVLGIKLISEQTGQPVGAGQSFLRALCHVVDGIPCYVGYLWPLWDGRRQTLADKVRGTVVLAGPGPSSAVDRLAG
jgi:uncharacterized RDD family membrane protein YckC